MRKLFLLMIFLVTINLLFPMVTMAAPPDPDCDPLDPLCPIDGGVTLLIAAGIGLGARKVMMDNKQD